jgi:hypothetical protein
MVEWVTHPPEHVSHMGTPDGRRRLLLLLGGRKISTQSLQAIFLLCMSGMGTGGDPQGAHHHPQKARLVMSWNRRMKSARIITQWFQWAIYVYAREQVRLTPLPQRR